MIYDINTYILHDRCTKAMAAPFLRNLYRHREIYTLPVWGGRPQNCHLRFYHSSCPHCWYFAPVFRQLGAAYRGSESVHVAACNCMEKERLQSTSVKGPLKPEKLAQSKRHDACDVSGRMHHGYECSYECNMWPCPCSFWGVIHSVRVSCFCEPLE